MDTKLLDEVLKNENKFAVAVSGGLDSVCLLYMCADYAKTIGKKLYCFHINHGLREESEQEAKFVEGLCKKLHAEFVYKKLNVKEKRAETKTTIEETARNLRYSAFEKMAKDTGVGYICLAHHQEDQAETLLMHLLRGSGVKGACGMLQVSGMYVRPLLSTSKNQLENYAKAHNISYMQDESNFDTSYSRNFLRINVIPKLKEIQPQAAAHLCEFAGRMQMVDELIDSLVPIVELKKGEVEIKCINNPLLFARQVHNACKLLGVHQDVEDKHIKSVKKLFELKTGSQLHLPHRLAAYRDASGVVITRRVKSTNNKNQILSVGEFTFETAKVKVSKVKLAKFKDGVIFVDADKVHGSELRHPAKGDKFKKLGSSGSKLLSDYFTDKKIPQRKRQDMIVVANEKEVLAVLGNDVSENAKIEENSKILKITLEEIKC